uniref:RING-type domain-containing protein n=1 Tax=Haemonchus contortus TaxID=6289 RepID=A0A7I4XZD0_HAECO
MVKDFQLKVPSTPILTGRSPIGYTTNERRKRFHSASVQVDVGSPRQRFSSEQESEQEPNPLDIWMSSSLGERLSCSICCEIFYKAANVIPCGHNFCLSCIMRFMATQTDAECPQCRERIKDIGMAYTVNSIVDVLLEKDPDKKRTAEELQREDDMFAKAVIELRNKNRFFPRVAPPRSSTFPQIPTRESLRLRSLSQEPPRPRTPQRRTVSQASRQESSGIRSPSQGLIGRQVHTRATLDPSLPPTGSLGATVDLSLGSLPQVSTRLILRPHARIRESSSDSSESMFSQAMAQLNSSEAMFSQAMARLQDLSRRVEQLQQLSPTRGTTRQEHSSRESTRPQVSLPLRSTSQAAFSAAHRSTSSSTSSSLPQTPARESRVEPAGRSPRARIDDRGPLRLESPRGTTRLQTSSQESTRAQAVTGRSPRARIDGRGPSRLESPRGTTTLQTSQESTRPQVPPQLSSTSHVASSIDQLSTSSSTSTSRIPISARGSTVEQAATGRSLRTRIHGRGPSPLQSPREARPQTSQESTRPHVPSRLSSTSQVAPSLTRNSTRYHATSLCPLCSARESRVEPVATGRSPRAPISARGSSRLRFRTRGTTTAAASPPPRVNTMRRIWRI